MITVLFSGDAAKRPLYDPALREAAEKGLGGGQPRPVAEQEITESTAQDAAEYDAAHQDDRSWRR